VESFFELFFPCFREFFLSSRSMSIGHSVFKRFARIESHELAVDRFSTSVVPLCKFGLRDAVLVRDHRQ